MNLITFHLNHDKCLVVFAQHWWFYYARGNLWLICEGAVNWCCLMLLLNEIEYKGLCSLDSSALFSLKSRICLLYQYTICHQYANILN